MAYVEKKLEVDMRVKRLRLAFAVIGAQRTLSLSEETWRIFEEAVTALVPSDVGVGDICMDVTNLQFFSLSAVGTGEAIRIWFEVRVTKDSSLVCNNFQVRIDMSKASEFPLTDDGWKRFDETLSKLGRDTPLLEVVVGDNESTLDSVLDHTILAKAATEGRLRLRAVYPIRGTPEPQRRRRSLEHIGVA